MSEKPEYRATTTTEPDWFYMTSGGVDSVAAIAQIHETVMENYQKTPVLVYLDTTVGLPANRIYAEQLADHLGIQMVAWRTNVPYCERIEENGCPGPGDHGRTQNALKGRQMDKLATISGHPVYVSGIRWEESRTRATYPKAEYQRRRWHVKPVIERTREECRDLIAEAGYPENPLWEKNYPTDCWCGAYGSPEELLEVEADYPEFAQRIREYVEAVETGDKRETWGWGALSEKEQRSADHMNDDDQMQLCGPACGAGRRFYGFEDEQEEAADD